MLETNKKVVEIEQSQTLLSGQYDTLKDGTSDNKHDIDLVKIDVKKLVSERKELFDENKKIRRTLLTLNADLCATVCFFFR